MCKFSSSVGASSVSDIPLSSLASIAPSTTYSQEKATSKLLKEVVIIDSIQSDGASGRLAIRTQ
jgi:hypothetical protein